MRRLLLLFALLSSTLCVHSTCAEDWPAWRGPTGDGVAGGTRYPIRWSTTDNVAWSVELPGPGGSTPAVWNDRIFVTCGSNGQNLALCFNRRGEMLWQRELGAERAAKHRKGSGSNPSPTTDGQFVYFYFKSGDLSCLDFEGDVVWSRNLQTEIAADTLWWDLGTSPVLTTDAVVVACVQSGPSYLAAFQKATGDLLWKHDRLLDAPEEANQTYATPIVCGPPGEQRLIVLGADHVTEHSAVDGQEIWRVGGLNPDQDKYFRSIASPVLSGDLVVAPYGRGGALWAIRRGGRGDVTNTHVAWSSQEFSSDVPTPAAHDGRVFVLTDKGQVATLASESGRAIWDGRLPSSRFTYSASPILADGRLYVTREDGATFVLAIDQFQILAENQLEGSVVATPVFVDGQIFLRTSQRLYCIGKPQLELPQ